MSSKGKTAELERLRRIISENGLGALVLTDARAVQARLPGNAGVHDGYLLVGVYSHYDEKRIEDDIASARVEVARDRRYVRKA